jgi:hypothetical protein
LPQTSSGASRGFANFFASFWPLLLLLLLLPTLPPAGELRFWLASEGSAKVPRRRGSGDAEGASRPEDGSKDAVNKEPGEPSPKSPEGCSSEGSGAGRATLKCGRRAPEMPSDASSAALAALLRARDGDACRTRALGPSGKSARASALSAKGSPRLSGGRRHRYLDRRNHRQARRLAAGTNAKQK